jgi:hypothetical protein
MSRLYAAEANDKSKILPEHAGKLTSSLQLLEPVRTTR